jgi:hypothetical protein
LFLIETKIRNENMQKLRVSMGFEGLLTFEPIGKSWGLALLWRDNKEVTILNYSQCHISTKISLRGFDYSWLLIGFYGHPNPVYWRGFLENPFSHQSNQFHGLALLGGFQ